MRPCRCRASSVCRRLVSEAHGSFAGCLADISGARPLPGSCLPFGRSVPPDPHVPPAWFDSHLGGLLRAPVPRLLHLVPAGLRWFPLRTRRRPSRWLPSGMPGVESAGLPRSDVSHPSKNSPPARLRARDANLGSAAPRRRGRCPLAVFTTSRRCSDPEASALGSAVSGIPSRASSFHGLCSPSRSSPRPRPRTARRLHSRRARAEHPTACAASVRSRCCCPSRGSDLHGVLDVKDRCLSAPCGASGRLTSRSHRLRRMTGRAYASGVPTLAGGTRRGPDAPGTPIHRPPRSAGAPGQPPAQSPRVDPGAGERYPFSFRRPAVFS
jgi:hypothetical protein